MRLQQRNAPPARFLVLGESPHDRQMDIILPEAQRSNWAERFYGRWAEVAATADGYIEPSLAVCG